MALSATRLATPIKNALITSGAADIPATAALALAIATAVVSEITTNAVVPAGTLTSPAGAVTGATTVT